MNFAFFSCLMLLVLGLKLAGVFTLSYFTLFGIFILPIALLVILEVLIIIINSIISLIERGF